ncbi:MAG: choice-of-anchor J domain-containing protein, partial [Dysgonamonadaceae bacterium]|nr:choice-of-anchor J domain-containing protein [Dysgonamonadaceae bacterium]
MKQKVIILISIVLLPAALTGYAQNNTVINAFPYIESFEGAYSSFWKIYDIDNDGNCWKNNSGSVYIKTGEHSIQHGAALTAQDGWLVSPEISIPANENLSFSVWMKNQFSYPDCTNRILISTGSNNPVTNRSDFVEKWSSAAATAEIWEEIVISLSQYKGMNIYIAFQYQTPGKGGHGWFMDDVSIISLHDYDAGVSAITQPVEGAGLGNSETVTVKVKN